MPDDIASKPLLGAATGVPRLRKPETTDGSAVWELIRDCEPLDENSMYCNLV